MLGCPMHAWTVWNKKGGRNDLLPFASCIVRLENSNGNVHRCPPPEFEKKKRPKMEGR